MENESKFNFIKRVDSFGMDSVEVRAVEFAHNPWKYMSYFVRERRNKNENHGDMAMYTIDELCNLLQVAIDDNLQVENIHLHSYLHAESEHDRLRGLFQFLKDISIAKDELRTWVEIKSDEDDPANKLIERSERIILDEIYGK